MAAVVLAILAISVWTGVQHDHREYLLHWTAVLDGADPWAGSNAYGPLHNLFAGLFAIGPLLPKLTFAALAVMCSALLLRGALNARATPALWVVLAAFLLHPIVVFSTYVYGQNDIVAAFFVLLALVARESDRPALAGLCIGFASLEKFYPLAIAGFLMLEGNRVLRLRIPVVAAGTFAGGMVLAATVWGSTALTPITFAAGRDAKMLSFYRFLTCHPDLVGGERAVQTLLDGNSLVVLLVAGFALIGLAWLGATWRSGTVLGCLAVFATYKVGHPQFYVTWLILFTWLLINGESGNERRVAVRLVPVVAFLAVFAVLYAITGALTGEWAFLRCYVSLPFLAVVIGSLVAALRVIWHPVGARPRLIW